MNEMRHDSATPPATPSRSGARAELPGLLANLQVSRRSGQWCVIPLPVAPEGIEVIASIKEAEGTSFVVRVEDARLLGIAPEFVGAWLTLEVDSALDAVGLTAAVSSALAKEGIPANFLAGFHHDHLLVPHALADLAISTIESLRADDSRAEGPRR